MNKTLILGSQSPRRKELLSQFTLPFLQVASEFDEDSIPFNASGEHYVTTLSEAKAKVLSTIHPSCIIITADTTVVCEGKNFGKPQNETEAFEFLSFLADRWQEVYTGVTVYADGNFWTAAELTRVLFNPLTPKQIKTYQKICHCYDKAGGYAIQSYGNLLIKRFEGSYDNVIGLPMNTLRKLLLNTGIDLWEYIHS